MKKFIFTIILLFSFSNIYSQYYFPRYHPAYINTESTCTPGSGKAYKTTNMFSRNNAIMLGITLGLSESQSLFNKQDNSRCKSPMLGVVSKIYGVVCNFGFYLNHSNSTDVDYHRNEDSGFYLHFGYNFPVAKWFSFAPLIGYSKHVIGDYDGSQWRYVNGIQNKFIQTGPSYSGFDYGLQISFDIPCGKICSLNVPAALTRHIFYFGLGFTFNIGNI